MIPVGQWTFLATATSTKIQEQSGFRYSLLPTLELWMRFRTRAPPAPDAAFYDLTPNAILDVGGDHTGQSNSCDCELRYARVYINYYPSSQDEYINLAMMDTGNKILLVPLTD